MTVNSAGVADVSARRILQLALGVRIGGQLGEPRRIGTQVGLRHELCAGDKFFVDGETGLRLAVATSVSEKVHSNAEGCSAGALTDVALGAGVVYRDVSGDREATAVALMGSMATVLMGGERASMVAANLLVFRDVRFEWDPSGLWVDPGVLVANGVMRVYIGQRVCRLPCSLERAYHFCRSGVSCTVLYS